VAKNDLPAGTCFLIDHAWSFLSADDALAGLSAMPQLLERVCGILGVGTDMDDIEPAERAAAQAAMAPAAVLRALAPLLGSYRIAAPEDGAEEEEVFVMMDEVGCRIQACQTAPPNCAVESLVDTQSGVAFCMACLTRPVAEGEPLLRAGSPFFEANASERLLGGLDTSGAGGGSGGAGVGDGADGNGNDNEASGGCEPEPEVDMSLPALRIGVMESVSQNKHCSLIYKPFAKTARRIAILAAAHGYRTEYIQLTSADFPAGVLDDGERVIAAARAISARCEIVLGFCLGELMRWSKDGTYVVDEALRPRCQRVDDVLAVYGAMEEAANGGVVAIPPASFQRFCFGKARYMRQLVACGVPIAPTLFVDRTTMLEEAERLAGAHAQEQQSAEAAAAAAASSEEGERWLLAPKTSAVLAACGVVAARVAAEVADLRTELWAPLQPRGEPQGTTGGLQLVDGRFFVKGDSGWCRNGNSEIKIEATAPAAVEADAQVAAAGEAEEARAARQAAMMGASSSSPSSPSAPSSVSAAAAAAVPAWGLAQQELFAARLQSILYRQLAVDMAGAVHLQPCITALTGQSQEFRGFIINGELVAVASTYFRLAGAVSYNLTDVQSEVLLVDHGLPDAEGQQDAMLGGVPFARIRGVMEAAAAAIIQLVGHVPVAIRTDCAVDPVNGLVVLSEIEGGLVLILAPPPKPQPQPEWFCVNCADFRHDNLPGTAMETDSCCFEHTNLLVLAGLFDLSAAGPLVQVCAVEGTGDHRPDL